jgi:hypothetical protein
MREHKLSPEIETELAPQRAVGFISMPHSRLIAGLIGPLLIAMGAAMLINRDLFPKMADELVQNHGLIVLSGILLLLAGVAIVRVHNVWTGGWPIIITVFGWLAIVGGLARMWFPELAAPIVSAVGIGVPALAGGGLFLLALGAFLSYKAYGPDTSSR